MDPIRLLNAVCRGIECGSLPDYDCNNGVWMRVFPQAAEADLDVVLHNAHGLGFDDYARNELEGSRYETMRCGGTQVHAYFVPAEQTLRVIADGYSAPFPRTPCETLRRCDTTLWMIETDHTYIDCGMCFVLRCADNSFFVIDSGHFLQLNDHKRLYRFLRERTPVGEKVVIGGWFVTHAHDDHVCKMMDFLAEDHADVTVEAIYCNTVSPDGHRDSHFWGESNRAIMQRFEDTLATCGIPVVKLHSGQRFFVRDLTVDVLCTHEDVYPGSLENYNDCSTVLMIETAGCRVCIPGDAGAEESGRMTARFDETLRCDVMQQSHHGHFGTSVEFYKKANARLLLFPNTQIIFDEDLPRYEPNRVAIALADAYHVSSNGTVEVPLPYTKGGETVLPDETFENFDRIQALWGYTYTAERKQQLFDEFLRRSGLPPMSEIKP